MQALSFCGYLGTTGEGVWCNSFNQFLVYKNNKHSFVKESFIRKARIVEPVTDRIMYDHIGFKAITGNH